MPADAPQFASLVDQLANVRRWNDDRGWEIPEFEMEMVDLTEAGHASPLVVDLIAVYLPGDAEGKMDGVQRTCAELWDIAASRQPNSWCWDERRQDDVKPVRLLAGMGHEPGIRRVTLDLAAHWDRRRGPADL